MSAGPAVALPADDSAIGRGRRLAAAVVLVLATALCVAAGCWQLQQARGKERLETAAQRARAAPALLLPATRVDGAALDQRRITARGEWDAARTILLDNRVLDGVVGYQVVTPLRLAGSGLYLLVDRGWIAAPPRRERLPPVTTAAGPVTVSGVAEVRERRFLELRPASTSGPVWQNLTLERFRAASGLDLQPLLLIQQDEAGDGLRRMPAPAGHGGLRAVHHRGYALMWFALALVLPLAGLRARRRALTAACGPAAGAAR